MKSITTPKFWDSAWNYAKEYSTKYTLIDLFQAHAPESQRQLNSSRNSTELVLIGAKECLKSMPMRWCRSFLIRKLLEQIPAYKNWSLQSTSEMKKISEKMSLLTQFMLIGVIAPLAEEMIFRGLLQNLQSRINPKIAMISTHFIFGIVHWSPQAVALIINSSISSSLYYETGSIWASLAAHVVNNTAAWGCMLLLQRNVP